tara:strand:- start:953 stop:2248 length:1296 start_codon:yes stop_codon:yes gene_type:complete
MNNFKEEQICVAIVSEHASARFGGEAVLPLHYFLFLRKRGVDSWLIVHERTRHELEQTISPQDKNRVMYTRDTWLHRALWKFGSCFPHRIRCATTGSLMHLITQHMQRRVVKGMVKSHGVNVVHEPIPVSPKQPSLMYKVGAPVIIGPMNGGMTFPPAFQAMESRTERAAVWIGRKLSGVANLLVPGKRHASLLLVANERTAKALPPLLKAPVQYLVENGVDLTVWKPADATERPQKSGEAIRFVFMGRMIPLKAIDLLLRAFHKLTLELPTHELHLDLLGDGSDRCRLEELATHLGLENGVQFHGFLPQSQCAQILKECDAFVMPSLCDCGGAVVLESMAMGIPVIATNWGGPADYLDDTCGILVEPSSEEELVDGFASAMKKIADNPELIGRLSRNGMEKARTEYDWEIKAGLMVEHYLSVIDVGTPPD